jgi:hypothetical protein
VLTGHVLKDPDATIDYHADRIPNIRAVCPNRPIEAEGTLEDLRRVLSTPIPAET